VRDFAEKAFKHVNLNYKDHIIQCWSYICSRTTCYFQRKGTSFWK